LGRISRTWPWLELITPLTQQELGSGENAPLVESRLAPVLDKIRGLRITGSALVALSPRELERRDLGAVLWRASLLACQERREESQRVAQHALAKLPAELQLAVIGRVIEERTEEAPPEGELPR